MTTTAAGPDMHTYMPQEAPDPALTTFLQRGAGQAPELIGDDGKRLPLPAAMHDVLRHVAEALSSGMAVTVAPMNARLTTQEAAEFLGISRPTLVRMLERGDIPMEKPGRHRFVRLADLVDFQNRQHERRQAALDRMARDAAAEGLYEATDDGPPPRTR